jgi:hypothetical protein
MTTVYERLNALQSTLPDVQPPVVDGYVAAFVPFVRTGNLVYLAQTKDGKPWCGKVGEQPRLSNEINKLGGANGTSNLSKTATTSCNLAVRGQDVALGVLIPTAVLTSPGPSLVKSEPSFRPSPHRNASI